MNCKGVGADQYSVQPPKLTMANFLNLGHRSSGFPRWSSHVEDLLINHHLSGGDTGYTRG